MTEPSWLDTIIGPKIDRRWYLLIVFVLLLPLLLISGFSNYQSKAFKKLENTYEERFGCAPNDKMHRLLCMKACKGFSLREFKSFLNGAY